MLKKPYSSSELFDVIVSRLNEQSILPHHLDYARAAKQSVPVTSPDMCILNTLDFGESEGVYLDLTLKIYDPKSRIYEQIPFGTFRTSVDDREAMRDMGRILAEFICELKDFIKEHSDDFTWNGYTLVTYLADGTESARLYATSYNSAVKQADNLLRKVDIGRVFIIDNRDRTRREHILSYRGEVV